MRSDQVDIERTEIMMLRGIKRNPGANYRNL